MKVIWLALALHASAYGKLISWFEPMKPHQAQMSACMSPLEIKLSLEESAALELARARRIEGGYNDYNFTTVGIEESPAGPYYVIEYGSAYKKFETNQSHDDRFYKQIPHSRKELIAAPETLNVALGLNRPDSALKFVAVEVGEIPNADYIGYLAKGQFPISVINTYFLHDMKAHAASIYEWAISDPKTWNRLVKVAGALAKNPEANADKIKFLVGVLDSGSAEPRPESREALQQKMKSFGRWLTKEEKIDRLIR